MWHMSDGWGWWMGFSSISMIGFWVVIIWAIFTLRARWSSDRARVAEDAGTALEILERCYVRGELSDEQYETMRPHLSRPPGPVVVQGSHWAGLGPKRPEAWWPGQHVLYLQSCAGS